MKKKKIIPKLYYIEYASNSDRNKTSVEEYLNKFRPYLKNIRNDIRNSDT